VRVKRSSGFPAQGVVVGVGERLVHLDHLEHRLLDP
jgi:hypothetical protein